LEYSHWNGGEDGLLALSYKPLNEEGIVGDAIDPEGKFQGCIEIHVSYV